MSGLTWDALLTLAGRCTVRIEAVDGTVLGSGFLVATNEVLTCARVVSNRSVGGLRVRHTGPSPRTPDAQDDGGRHDQLALVRRMMLRTARSADGQAHIPTDLALLIVDLDARHPVVLLSSGGPELGAEVVAVSFGDDAYVSFVTAYPVGPPEAGPGCLGLSTVTNDPLPQGISGSLALDHRMRRVCGLVDVAADPSQPLDNRIVPVDVIYRSFPHLRAANAAKHPEGTPWRATAPLGQRERSDQTIIAGPTPAAPPSRESADPASTEEHPGPNNSAPTGEVIFTKPRITVRVNPNGILVDPVIKHPIAWSTVRALEISTGVDDSIAALYVCTSPRRTRRYLFDEGMLSHEEWRRLASAVDQLTQGRIRLDLSPQAYTLRNPPFERR